MEERIYRPGEKIGPYEVLSHRATGAETVLYAAVNRSPDAERTHPVALKVCRYDARMMGRDAVARFNDRLAREHLLLERVWHRNVARVFERQSHEGLAFYALELLEGPTLGTWWVQERRSYRELMRVYRQLAGALAYVHRHGMVHRDLKPSNVFIEGPRRKPVDGVDWGDPSDFEDGDALPFLAHAKAQAVLIDFSVAQSLWAAPLTLPGMLVGTAEYLSPEYARAALERSEVAYRAEPHEDVYQMGVLLYLLLTGRHPVRTPAGQLWDLLEEIRDVTPPEPRVVNAQAPAALSALCMLCLSKRAAERPRDGADLLRRLVEALRQDADSLASPAPSPNGEGETPLVGGRAGGPEPKAPQSKATKEKGFVASARRQARVLLVAAFSLFCIALGIVGGLALGTVARASVNAPERANAPVVQEQLSATPPKTPADAPKVVAPAIVAGMPMPATPDPKWLKCPKDCGYGDLPSCTWRGHPQLRWVVGYLGTCWSTFENPLKGGDSSHPSKCSGANFYDPPSDAPPELLRRCFFPLRDDQGPPNTVEPHSPGR